MKRILSFLLCIMFLKAQVLAIHGPLQGSDFNSVSVVGTYSGVLVPIGAEQGGTDVLDPATLAVEETLNSLGLFAVAMPDSGPGSGSFMIFTGGRSFEGTVTAIGDPGEGKINAILEATYDFTDFVYDQNGDIVYQFTQNANGGVTATPLTQTYEAAVRGTMEATVISGAINQQTAASANYGRMEGDAALGRMYVDPRGGGDLVSDALIRYKVDGVKQSLTADGNTDFGGGSEDTGTVLLLF